MRQSIPEMPHEFTEGMKAPADHSLLISGAAYLSTYLNGSLDFSTPPDPMKLKLFSEASYAAAVVGHSAFATPQTYGERWRHALRNAGATLVIGAAALAEVAYDRNESPGLDDYISLSGASGVALATSMLLSLKYRLAAQQQLKKEMAIYAVSHKAAQEKAKAIESVRRRAERPVIASTDQELSTLLDAMEYTYAMDLVRMRMEEFPEALEIIFGATKNRYWRTYSGPHSDLLAAFPNHDPLMPHDAELYDEVERHAPWIDILTIPASGVPQEELQRLQSAHTSLYPNRKLPTEWKEPIRCGVALNGTTHYPRTDRVTAFREVWHCIKQEAFFSGDNTEPPLKTADDVLSYLVEGHSMSFFIGGDDDRPSRPRDTTSLRRIQHHYSTIGAA